MNRVLVLISLVAILLITPVNSIAQKSSANYVGFKLGTSFSKWVGEDSYVEYNSELTESRYSNRLNGSVFAGIGLNKILIIQIEFSFSSKGAEYDALDEYNNLYLLSYVHEYVEIPLTISINTNIHNNSYFGIYGGGAIAFHIDSRLEIIRLNNGDTRNIKDGNGNGAEFSILFGTRTKFNFISKNMQLDIRYSIGLKNVYKSFVSTRVIGDGNYSYEYSYEYNLDIKNRQIHISLGLEI